jgi:hypothetical protein
MTHKITAQYVSHKHKLFNIYITADNLSPYTPLHF